MTRNPLDMNSVNTVPKSNGEDGNMNHSGNWRDATKLWCVCLQRHQM